jgi:hypothetical protein
MRGSFTIALLSSTLLVCCADHDLGRITKVVNDGIEYSGTSAEAFANVIDLSSAKHDDHGFCFGQVAEPTVEDDRVSLGQLGERSPFNQVLRRLKLNRSYQFRPYVLEGDEVVYGDVQTARVTSTEGIVFLYQSLAAVSLTSANLTVTINGLGSLMCEDFGICYSTEPQPTIGDAVVGLGTLFSDTTYTATASGLNTYTTYHFRAFAKLDSSVVIYSDEQSLNISEPQLQTLPVEIFTSASAMFRAQIVSAGIYPVSNHGFCWGTSPQPTTAANVLSLGANALPGSMQSYISSLTSGVTYHVRPFLVSNGNTFYGDNATFTIQNPTLATGTVANTSGTTASATGELTLGNYPVIQRGHCWSTSPNPTVANNRTSLGAASASGSLVSNLNGLTLNQTYYVRAYAQDSVTTFYGAAEVFTANHFTSTTLTVVSNSNDTAVVGGNVSVTGNLTITEYGHCWVAGSNLPTINDSRTNLGSTTTGIPNYQSTLSGLQAGQQYRIRAYATDGQTVVYGDAIDYTNNNTVTFSYHSLSVTADGQLTTTSQVIISGNVTVLQYGLRYSPIVGQLLGFC